MIAMSLAQIAAVTGGAVADGDPATLVDAAATVDSRSVEPGGLFVAVQGEHADGHDFAAAAVRAGASGVLAARPVGVPAVVTANPVAALGRLARAVVDQLSDCRVIAITGSQGKTTTKDLLATILDRAGETVAALGSYNNELGVPLTALRAGRNTRHLLVEMGARGVGHIASLCQLTPPDVALVLNVGEAHIELFGGRAQIAAAKGELVEALTSDGLAVLNADDPLVRAMGQRSEADVVTFGTAAGADVRIGPVSLDSQGRPRFRLGTAQSEALVRLRLVGAHQAMNAAAAAAVALRCAVPFGAVIDALSAATPRSRWRMEVHRRADGVTVINDAYNANPSSMRAALATLTAIGTAVGSSGRTIAVLGEMRELGSTALAEHEALGRLAMELGVRRLVAVGPGAEPIHRAALDCAGSAECSRWVPDVAAALSTVGAELQPGDVVLVKASRAAGLERVAEALLAAEVSA